MTPISQTEIIKYISLIKPKNTFFEYGITNTILKNTINNIIGPIQYIFNQIISTGLYPILFKKCIVIHLYKSGDTKYCENYRPISLSLTLSKIFEKCLKSRILDFSDRHKFFYSNHI